MSEQFSQGYTVEIEKKGNFALALLAGIIAAILGAGLWMAVEVGLQMKIGFVAIAIGALVGFAIRLAGHGGSALYGVLGAVLTLVGCLGGEILTVLYTASSPQQSMLDLARTTDYVSLIQIIFTKMDPIGYLIYGIGIFEGYKLSIKK